jgi:hypothetical protein
MSQQTWGEPALPVTASDEIKAVYWRLVMEPHPDMAG